VTPDDSHLYDGLSHIAKRGDEAQGALEAPQGRERPDAWEPAGKLLDCDCAMAAFFGSDTMHGCRLSPPPMRACKCHLPLVKMGQDESAFKQFLLTFIE